MSTDLNLSIRPATTDQFTALYAILALAGEHMHRALDLSYWHPFPSSDKFIARLGERNNYAVYLDDTLVGTFGIGPKPEPYYREDMSEYWQGPDAQSTYFSTFAILPGYQQRGIGSWCMQQADQIARDDGYDWLRFDAVALNSKLLTFYSRLGYEQRGLLLVGSIQVMCYEKHLR